MSFSSQLAAAVDVDSVDEFEIASRARTRDAATLAGERRSYWAIYALGYVAEMILKSAYFRLIYPARPSSTPLDRKKELNKDELKKRAASLGIMSRPRNLHDLLFWLEMIIEERSVGARPFPIDFSTELTAHVQTIARNWRESMRYHHIGNAAREHKQVFMAIKWLTQNHSRIWS
jgi:hypothetical protein